MIHVITIFDRSIAGGALVPLSHEQIDHFFSGMMTVGTFLTGFVVSFVLAWLFWIFSNILRDSRKHFFTISFVSSSALCFIRGSRLHISAKIFQVFNMFFTPFSNSRIRAITICLQPFSHSDAFALDAFVIANRALSDVSMLTWNTCEEARQIFSLCFFSRNQLRHSFRSLRKEP